MSKKTRVLICDDSAVMRRILATVLSQDGDLEVVYRAQHGQDALEHLEETKPDIVVLDVEMPVMDGIETVTAIRKRDKMLPIVMFSSLTSGGAEATFDALNAGANDFATKPAGVGHLDRAVEAVKRDLVVKIKELTARRRLHGSRDTVSSKRVVPTANRPPRRNGTVKVVAIGVSTGGPKALSNILSCLNVQVPVLIVQHMPPVFTALLAERLDTVCKMPVREAVDNAVVLPGDVWIAPGDYHMQVERFGVELRLKLNQDAQENSVRPAVDPLFRSVAKCYGDTALGIVLTGMGKDGLEGSRVIREQGGQIIAQDEATSAVWGMPRQVAESELADRILPVDQVALEITQRTRPSDAPELAAKN